MWSHSATTLECLMKYNRFYTWMSRTWSSLLQEAKKKKKKKGGRLSSLLQNSCYLRGLSLPPPVWSLPHTPWMSNFLWDTGFCLSVHKQDTLVKMDLTDISASTSGQRDRRPFKQTSSSSEIFQNQIIKTRGNHKVQMPLRNRARSAVRTLDTMCLNQGFLQYLNSGHPVWQQSKQTLPMG